MSVEADPAASRNAIANLVTRRLATLTERDVPDRLMTEIRDLPDRTWIAAEDAPTADDVVQLMVALLATSTKSSKTTRPSDFNSL
jgi:hypothetical protein